MVNPGWEAASGPAARACEASSIVAAPAAMSTYSDQLEKTAPMPSSRCELSSLMTAAMKPHETPVAAPSTAARRVPPPWPPGRRVPEPPGRRPRPEVAATARPATPAVARPATSQEKPGACSRPPDGDATRRKTPIPADMAAAASQSRRLIRPEPATAR